eukprot:COSAG05_NODE_11922_length_490_cov_1.056266_1_plen_45_part_00
MGLTESKTAAYNESSQIAATERVAAGTITRSHSASERLAAYTAV